MAFAEILEKTLAHEGEYVNDPIDRGGETYKGIARRHHPDWEGWAIIDENKGPDGVPDEQVLEADDNLLAEVAMFYHDNFWSPSRADKLPDEIQGEYFDMCVNFGQRGGCRILQRAANLYRDDAIEEDGYIGPNTIAAAQPVRIEVLKACRVARYVELVDGNKTQIRFLRGWYRRAIS